MPTQNTDTNTQMTSPSISKHAKDQRKVSISEDGQITFYNSNSLSGNYLAARFAQDHYDWQTASAFFEIVMRYNPQDTNVINRAMILSMGAGQPQRAVRLAQKLVDLEKAQGKDSSALPLMILAVENFKKQDYEAVKRHVEIMPNGSLSDFMMPLLRSWTAAANGEYKIDNLNANTIHLYHGFLIGDFLDKREDFETMLNRALAAQGLSIRDLERAGDVYTVTGQHDKALKIYEEAAKAWPENKEIEGKIESLNTGEKPVYFKKIETAEKGMALAFQDMTQLLFNEKADDSARIFGNMALYLDPSLSETHLLLGYIDTRNERRDDAIKHYNAITKDQDDYVRAQRMAADLMEESGDHEGAVIALENLYALSKDIDALIQKGDIYRRQENFQKAVKTYDRAINILGAPLPASYWHLYYMRGMAHERLGDWKPAEKDLLKALDYKPNNALVLNYLGYAWADRGEHLDRALKMIKKAVKLEPNDGYIMDSLGWVYYRRGDYELAVERLEDAVALMPYDPIINDHLGDAYWKAGRNLEARFQWERARNYADETKPDDAKLIGVATQKLEKGLTPEIEEMTQDTETH